MTNHASPQTHPPAEKMSAKILGVSDGFIEAAETLDERQDRLMAVCLAWNLACEKPDDAARALKHWAVDFALANPQFSAEEIEIKTRFMKTLIERKRRLYPDDMRRLLEGEIVPEDGGKYRVNVTFARMP